MTDTPDGRPAQPDGSSPDRPQPDQAPADQPPPDQDQPEQDQPEQQPAGSPPSPAEPSPAEPSSAEQAAPPPAEQAAPSSAELPQAAPPQPDPLAHPPQAGYPGSGYPPPGYPVPVFPPPGFPDHWYALPQPGIIPLRPLQLGDLYSGAFRNIRMNPAVTFGLAFIAMLIVVVSQVISRVATAVSPLGIVVSLVVSILIAAAGAVLNGAQVVVLSRAALGRRTGFAEAVATIAPKFGGLVGVGLLLGLIGSAITVGGFLVIGLVGLLGGVRGGFLTIGVVVLLAVGVLTIWVSVLLVMAAPVYVLENRGVVESLRRSRALVAGQWWRVFGILLLTGIMLGAIALVVIVAVGIAWGAAAYAGGAGVLLGVLLPLLIGVLVIGTVLIPFFVGVTNLLYIDTRIRRERFDLDLARAAAEGTELA